MTALKTQRNMYIIFMVLSVILSLAVIVASFLDSEMQYGIFHGVWMVFLLGTFVLLQIICLLRIKPDFSVYRMGFYVLHIGIVLFLAGCFTFYIAGDTVTVSVPVDSESMYNVIKRDTSDSGNQYLELDFYMGISEFKVERYENSGVDKDYDATLKIMPPKSRDIEYVSLKVNHPHKVDGWKIYLMNYDKTTESTVQLTLKNDPGEMLTYTGIWAITAGSVIMCFPGRRKKRL